MEFDFSTQEILQSNLDGIVLGVFKNNDFTDFKNVESGLSSILQLGDFKGKATQKVLLYNVDGITSPRVVLVGLGDPDKATDETVRLAAAAAAQELRDRGAKHIGVPALGNDAQSTAEGFILGLYQFDELKEKKDDYKEIEKITFFGPKDEFQTGILIAQAQNEARRLAELPSNLGTPSYFVKRTKELFEGIDNVEIVAHDENWAAEMKMGSFLSVASGSDEPAKFLEIHYRGGNEDAAPIVYAGKGITFDSGGISIKGSDGMGLMRGDCGGAAAVIGTCLAIARLQLHVNVIGLTPLTENMPSGKATKPSDVVFASNGKSIEVDNTDAEGRLVLADALVYADSFKPDTVIDIATLTGAMMVALGDHYIGAFCRSDDLWHELDEAGRQTFEKFWRMPLDKLYKKQLESTLADLKNVGGRNAGSVTAAMFLSEFSTVERWCHLDIAGTAWTTAASGYKPKGMTGVPVRALTRFAQNKANR